jgi:hypothetical protein
LKGVTPLMIVAPALDAIATKKAAALDKSK